MMAQTPPPIKVHKVYKVSPSQTTTTTTTLPLTFFDIRWLRLPPVERLFFYAFPNPTISFFDSLLPNLKRSLELTLQHFFPLAGNITWPQHSPIPTITYFPGHDSVSLTVSESNDDFDHVSSDFCEVSKRRRLVPGLSVSDDKTSLLALQVTLFPNSGFVIGITTHHAGVDGNCSTVFVKAWAYACSKIMKHPSLSTLPTISLPENLTPFLDRSVIKDAKGLAQSFSDAWMNFSGPNNRSVMLWKNKNNREEVQLDNNESVKGVFELKPSHIQKLKNYVKSKTGITKVSTFSVTVAYSLSCLVKAEQPEQEQVALVFPVDCRSRLEPVVSPTYFGNCLMGRLVLEETEKVMASEGFVTVLKGISEVLNGLESGVLNDVEKWQKKIESVFLEGKKRAYSIAGSTRFGVYGVDFGYGRPKKVDVASVDKTGAFALSESRDGDGGVEIALALKKEQMEAKGVGSGLWVNLSSHPGRSIFALYKSSKDFKMMFVKIRSVLNKFSFYLNEYLEERFLLSWSPEPVQILDVEDICADDDIIMKLLIDGMESKELLSVVELLKWDVDK